MQLLKNKHLILAMFVAPALAIIAYFAVDHVVSEEPHSAIQGSSYMLVAKSNCRYKSGICTLENGDVEVKLRVENLGHNQVLVLLSSVLPVQSAIISLVDELDSRAPKSMTLSTEQPDVWSATLYKTPVEGSILRLALNISGTHYYAETTTVFIDYETSFSQKNFSR